MILIEKGFITFLEDNNFTYFQDHAWFRNVPKNIKFKIEVDTLAHTFNNKKNSIWLIADGYGFGVNNRPLGHYGNGAICIYKKELINYLKGYTI